MNFVLSLAVAHDDDFQENINYNRRDRVFYFPFIFSELPFPSLPPPLASKILFFLRQKRGKGGEKERQGAAVDKSVLPRRVGR